MFLDLFLLWLVGLFCPTQKQRNQDDALTYIILDELEGGSRKGNFSEYQGDSEFNHNDCSEGCDWDD